VSGATVSIGGVSATGVTFGSATSLTATTPAGATGTQNVVVTNPDGQTGTLLGGFSYSAAALNGPTSVLISSNSGIAAVLSLYAPTATEMYITNSVGCSAGGSWESLSSSKNWTLVDSGDGTATVFVRFRSGSSNSGCVSHRRTITATPLEVEGTSCSGLLSGRGWRGTGTYLIDPDGVGALPSENHFCNMEYSGGGWTLISRTFANNSNISGGIPTVAEYESLSSVGSLTANKYILGNGRQGFTNWGAIVNGVGLNPVADFNGNSQKYTSYVGGTTARTCNWQNRGGSDFVIATTAGGACLKFLSGPNDSWLGSSVGSRYASLLIQGSSFDLGATTFFAPFNIGIINGADNDYCTLMQNGTITVGHGYTCRGSFLGSQAVAQSDYIEVYATNAIASCAGDCYLEGSSPNFAQALAIGTERQGPSGSALTLAFANGTSGFKIWKEKSGTKILNATGLVANGWQKQLTRAGTAFAAGDFTTGANIAGRVCPPNVFLSHSDMTATGRCLYYDAGNAAQALNAATGTVAEDFLLYWNNTSTGRGVSSSFYEGNIKTCADKGMRLPVLYETTAQVPQPFTSSGPMLPNGDGITPTYAASNGVPSMADWTWTASGDPGTWHYGWRAIYHIWKGSSFPCDFWGCEDATFLEEVRCVLPNSVGTTGTNVTNVLTSGSSMTVPTGSTSVKIWVIGGGGGGGGSIAVDGTSGGGGGAGGVAYKTFTVTAGQTINYTTGSAGLGGTGAANGSNGGTTSATVAGVTIFGYGGSGGTYNTGVAASGGSHANGDGGSIGGSGPGVSGDTGGGSGGAIGGVAGVTADQNGANGANSADILGLFAALGSVTGYPTTSGGGASPTNSSSTANGNHGLPATGFGCGGGSAGFWGGNGGSGLYGGGGGGASGLGATQSGGNGGQGVVVMQFN
jgi:hypothetical protein